MNKRPTAPARFPPAGIVGLEAGWSRLVRTPDTDAVGRTWHVLDSWAGRPDGAVPDLTLLCVHGNPSWSFLWRNVLRQVVQSSNDRVRVIAVDQLDMGYSERTGMKRTLATRVDDLCQLTGTLAVRGPVVTVAHDWGGPISLGWALRHLQGAGASKEHSTSAECASLAGVVLTNTAVHQPPESKAPAVIRLLRSPLILRNATVNTRAFILGALEMSRPRLAANVRAGFQAPYQQRSQRSAIADFVADIPLDAEHESAAALDEIAAGMAQFSEVPVLLAWGPRDRVFSDLYLHDLERRLPHANVHRFPVAAHFVSEDADVAGAVTAWLEHHDLATTTAQPPHPRTALRPEDSRQSARRALTDFSVASNTTDAIVEIAPVHRRMNFGELSEQVEHLAAGMQSFGINPGGRVAVMVTPGIDLCLAVYACWRLGATLVLVDSGLGRVGMQRALRSANPAFLIGIDKALIAAKLLRWPGKRIAVAPRSPVKTRALSIVADMSSLIERGKGHAAPPPPTDETVAALAFTSGSTGPSKGVIYRHHQIKAQRDALMSLYDITENDRLVAAFAPFALYGPTMGITSIVPDMDVTAPGTLDAQSLADAVALIQATLVFASPAALRNVVATGMNLTQAHQSACSQVRLVLSAGAPVRVELLTQTATIFPAADLHTPYGMTEALPITDILLSELLQTDTRIPTDESPLQAPLQAPARAPAEGVCVGHPLAGVLVRVDPLDATGNPQGELSVEPGVLGEIMVQAAHAREGYDRLWLTEHRASQPAGWHRTGDVGQLDSEGRLWVGGRLGHIITTPAGIMAPVESEQRVETLPEVCMAAVVGVGPAGTQVIVVVVELFGSSAALGGASMALTDKVRKAVGSRVDVAAVLVVRKLPVDRRHNSKVDRSALAVWASRTLSGERVTPP